MDTLSLWKVVGATFAVFCVFRAFRRKPQPTSDKTIVLQKPSLFGRIGAFLMGHTILSIITGILGFNIILVIGSILCAIPIWIMGGEVHLPRPTVSWVNALITKTKDAFSDAKDGIREKIRDGKEAVVGKITGKKKDESTEDDTPGEEVADVSPDSDEYWSGAAIPHVSAEEIVNERLGFDALPPDQKIAIFATAKPIEGAVPRSTPDIYAPFQWYQVRTGRSTYSLTTPERIAMYTTMWSADRDHTHGMEAKTRAHFTRISPSPVPKDFKECCEGFGKLPAAERFAAFNAAWKMLWPLPESVTLQEGRSHDQQYYQVRICPDWTVLLTRDEWAKAKDAAFEEMRAADLAAAEPKTARLMRTAREKAESIAHNIKSKAAGKAADVKHKAAEKAKMVASTAKVKGAQVGRDLKVKAEEGVKEGAKGLFWKALGY